MDGHGQFNVGAVSRTIIKGETAGGTRGFARIQRAHAGIVEATGQGRVVGIKGLRARHFNDGTFADILVGVKAEWCNRARGE